MSEIIILVRADDIGMAQAVNQACIHVYEKGIARSVELMAPCPWFDDAVHMLTQSPGFDVGVHLTLSSEWDRLKWGPLTRARSLTTSSGYFCRRLWPSGEVREAFIDLDWQLDEIEAELRAQIERVLQHLPATHLTGHMGVVRLDEPIGALVARLEQEYDLRADVSDFQRLAAYGEGASPWTGRV